MISRFESPPGLPLYELYRAYHVHRNLPIGLTYFDPRDGRIRPPHPKGGHQEIEEGKENGLYAGVLTFRNGNTLKNKLIEKGYVKPRDVDDSHLFTTAQDVFNFLEGDASQDGVHIYESLLGQRIRVGKVYEPQDISLEDKLPADFVHLHPPVTEDRERYFRLSVGTKTRLAVALTQMFPDISAVQLKESGYGPLRLGKVVDYRPGGVAREFFFQHIPLPVGGDFSDAFLDEEHRIIGVERRYELQGGVLRRTQERVVTPEEVALPPTVFFRDDSHSVNKAA